LVDMRLEQKAAGLAANNERSSATTLSNTFNGMVVDRLHRPVANATVQIPNLNIVTVTDNKGFFSFAAPDTVLSVSIASVGFETQQLSLHNNETLNQITLKPDSKALNEVAVNGYGVTRKKEASSKAKHVTITILGAEPVVSWIKYNDYLDQNKRIPADAKDFHGETVVAFTVDNKNTLKNFRIERSINEQLDAEAIRLVKEGPPWRLLKGKKATVSVIVKF
ncbi:MAG: carboxypeptidase-like regulatory domain-containing protein, partial [Bacteroidota bacterium]